MAYRVVPRSGTSHRFGGRRRGDCTLTRNAILSGVALSCLVVASAGVLMLGREHNPGSLPNYTASHKSLKIALVEPAQQAQMEAPTAVAGAPVVPSAADIRVKIAAVEPAPQTPKAAPPARIARVPMPPAKPRQLVAAAPLPRERVVEKAPELSAPVTIAALGTDAADAVAPSPQPSPPRGEGEEIVASAEAPSEATAEAKPDAQAEVADTKPLPTTFGPARPAMPPFQLTSYAATSEQIFQSDITGSIGNPLRDLDSLPAKSAAPETTKSLARAVAPSPRPAPQSRLANTGKPEVDRADGEQAPVVKLKKPRAVTIKEKLWGSTVRLASLTPLQTAREANDQGGIPRPPFDRQTAVYVITDKKVYLPDGTELEAHSGFGQYMDDPRFVHLRMRGATPPRVYNLKMREALFHGVEAIRMLPIGGDESIFGRDGILAHSYLLGPRGQSHGCVSFRDYDAFLDAFKDGKINRLAVMARLD